LVKVESEVGFRTHLHPPPLAAAVPSGQLWHLVEAQGQTQTTRRQALGSEEPQLALLAASTLPLQGVQLEIQPLHELVAVEVDLSETVLAEVPQQIWDRAALHFPLKYSALQQCLTEVAVAVVCQTQQLQRLSIVRLVQEVMRHKAPLIRQQEEEARHHQIEVEVAEVAPTCLVVSAAREALE
jgi:hypothetical protein